MEFSALKEIRRELHQIPELGFKEVKTQRFLLETIKKVQTDRVEVTTWRTGILVRVAGTAPEKTIGFRCDIDALPIFEQTNYSFSSKHEGRMHACGHDFHMTIALGALDSVISQPIKDNALFIFQPAEEGPGGALPMLESEEFQAWKPDEIFALHIAPDLPAGTVASKPGTLFANTSELFLDFTGKGGHAAYPHLTKDMTVAASSFTVHLQQVISRFVDPLEKAVVTIGKMESGYVQNAIAETARLEGTIRTFQPETIDLVKKGIEQIARGFEISHDCRIAIDYGANYYQVFNHEDYVELFAEAAREAGLVFQKSEAAMTGEDFGYMLKSFPGFMFWLGVEAETGLHSARLQPKEEALEAGVRAVEAMLRRLSR